MSAMCAVEDGDLELALQHMMHAENLVGRTAEVVCRYAICWSYFDMSKFHTLVREALELNAKHPRTNYILGIEAVSGNQFEKAIGFYQTALENYPKGDRFHLNETYNNLGRVYFGLGNYAEAKNVWEKGLVLLPTDQMTKRNLSEFIYNNPSVPKALREISPFIEKFLAR